MKKFTTLDEDLLKENLNAKKMIEEKFIITQQFLKDIETEIIKFKDDLDINSLMYANELLLNIIETLKNNNE